MVVIVKASRSTGGTGDTYTLYKDLITLDGTSQVYFLQEVEDGKYDCSEWFTAKKELKKQNPLINLPYIIDGNRLISQTNACFSYLGRKLDMWGSTEDEAIECEQLLCEVGLMFLSCSTFCVISVFRLWI